MQQLFSDNNPILSDGENEFLRLKFLIKMILFVIMKNEKPKASLNKKAEKSFQTKVYYKNGLYNL